MCALNEIPMCPVCLRRPRPDQWTLADSTVIHWQGCLCDTPAEVREHWKALGYPDLPLRQQKPPLVVNGTKVEGDVSFHPRPGRVSGEAEIPISVNAQRQLQEAIASATPEQAAKLAELFGLKINNGEGTSE